MRAKLFLSLLLLEDSFPIEDDYGGVIVSLEYSPMESKDPVENFHIPPFSPSGRGFPHTTVNARSSFSTSISINSSSIFPITYPGIVLVQFLIEMLHFRHHKIIKVTPVPKAGEEALGGEMIGLRMTAMGLSWSQPIRRDLT